MIRQTPIADTIDLTNSKAQYDSACKKILAHKEILAWILKSTVSEFRNFDIQEIAFSCIEGTPSISEIPVNPGETNAVLTGTNNENDIYLEGKTTFDIYFHAVYPHDGKKEKLFINMEGQKSYYPGYPLQKRGIFYCSRMLSAQYHTEFTDPHYENMRKVYSIWICMNPSEKDSNTVTRYFLSSEALAGTRSDNPECYDLLELILICLHAKGKRCNTDILNLLNTLFSVSKSAAEKKFILENEFFIPMTKEFEEDIILMCNISEFIFDQALEQGIEQGIERGIEQGIERGIKQGENRFGQLTLLLLADKRYPDLEKASENEEYRKLLYQQYNI